MKIALTIDQALQIAANAVNASAPMGMGMLHYKNTEYRPEQMRSCVDESGLHIDYFQGRMVKLRASCKDGLYSFSDSLPRHDYQSWASTYPTYDALIQSVVNSPSAPQSALE